MFCAIQIKYLFESQITFLWIFGFIVMFDFLLAIHMCIYSFTLSIYSFSHNGQFTSRRSQLDECTLYLPNSNRFCSFIRSNGIALSDTINLRIHWHILHIVYVIVTLFCGGSYFRVKRLAENYMYHFIQIASE